MEEQRMSVATWYAANMKTVGAGVTLIGTRLSGSTKARKGVNDTGSLTPILGTREWLEARVPFCTPALTPCQSTLFLREVGESP